MVVLVSQGHRSILQTALTSKPGATWTTDAPLAISRFANGNSPSRCRQVTRATAGCYAVQRMTSLVVLVLAHLASPGQLQYASLTVFVTDANQRPLASVPVALTDPIGSVLQEESTDAAGRITFKSVAPGRYELRAAAAGGPPLHLPITVTAALPLEVTIRIPAMVTDRVVVEASGIDQSSFHVSLAGDSIAQVPARIRGRALQDVVATMPGWSTEDNGLLHARGVDDGFLYVIDGVPVYERLDAVSGVAPDLLD